MDEQPISILYDLWDLSEGGAGVSVIANAEQRARLATWAGVDAVENFKAQVTVRRRSGNRFAYDATLSADIVQSCVVTLGPVRSQLALDISRTLHLAKFPASAKLAPEELSSGADEAPEEIQDSHYDVARPLQEEFALAIDPYPRCAGAAFEPPPDKDAAEGPFGILNSLKGRG
jgi:hypothetical protein